jgi:hypothetical protein
MLAVLFGVAWLIGATGVLHVSIEGVVAVGLMVLGASLVITGRTDWSLSRRSWPVWLGIAMIAVLIATSSTFGLGGALNQVSFGKRTVVVPTSALPETVHGGFGTLTVDVSGISLASPETLRVVSVAGKTRVNLPQNPDYEISLNARLFAGQICVNGQRLSGGLSPQVHETIGLGPQVHETIGSAPGPVLTLDVHQSAGMIQIGSAGCANR